MASISGFPVSVRMVLLADLYQTLAESRTPSTTFNFGLAFHISTALLRSYNEVQNIWTNFDRKQKIRKNSLNADSKGELGKSTLLL